MSAERTAAARLACAWLLAYPDEVLAERLPEISGLLRELPSDVATPLGAFLDHLETTDGLDLQQHYVSVFDMKCKACPYLTYWTDGDTRNRGQAILRFQQAYLDVGFDLAGRELPDHLAVVLEFAALGDRLTGEALLAEHAAAIHLLRDALATLGSPYQHVLDGVVATMPRLTPEIERRMHELAASGPPAETVGLEPYALTLDPVGGRR